VSFDIGGYGKLVPGDNSASGAAGGSKRFPSFKPGLDGVIEIPVGTSISVLGAPIDATGRPLVCSYHCASFHSETSGILEIENDGSKEFFVAAAARPGETTLTVSSSNATINVVLRVIAIR
jgi:hypothetical protein